MKRTIFQLLGRIPMNQRSFEAMLGAIYLAGYFRGKRQTKRDLKEISRL